MHACTCMCMYIEYVGNVGMSEAFRSFEEAHVLMLLKPWATCTGTCTPNIPEGESIFCDAWVYPDCIPYIHIQVQLHVPVQYGASGLPTRLFIHVPVVQDIVCLGSHDQKQINPPLSRLVHSLKPSNLHCCCYCCEQYGSWSIELHPTPSAKCK